MAPRCWSIAATIGPIFPFRASSISPAAGARATKARRKSALRELAEEFGIGVPVDRIHYGRAYLLDDGATMSHFFAVFLTQAEVAAVRFGDEGQDWALLPAADFIADDDAVPRLRDWLAHYLTAMAGATRYSRTTSENPGKA